MMMMMMRVGYMIAVGMGTGYVLGGAGWLALSSAVFWGDFVLTACRCNDMMA